MKNFIFVQWSEDTETNREEKIVVQRRRKMWYKTETEKSNDDLIIYEKRCLRILRILTQMQLELMVAMLLASIIVDENYVDFLRRQEEESRSTKLCSNSALHQLSLSSASFS